MKNSRKKGFSAGFNLFFSGKKPFFSEKMKNSENN
jgi:hypothetical protein